MPTTKQRKKATANRLVAGASDEAGYWSVSVNYELIGSVKSSEEIPYVMRSFPGAA